MTWRALLIGLVAVAGICFLDVYSGTVKGYGGFTGSYFPGGAVLVLVLLAVIVNALIKLVRRGWALTQAELMLVWCMGLVADRLVIVQERDVEQHLVAAMLVALAATC